MMKLRASGFSLENHTDVRALIEIIDETLTPPVVCWCDKCLLTSNHSRAAVAKRILATNLLNGRGLSTIEAELMEFLQAYYRQASYGAGNGSPSVSTPTPSPWIVNRYGQPISCQHNAIAWLTAHGYNARVYLDTFRQVVMVDEAPLTDEL